MEMDGFAWLDSAEHNESLDKKTPPSQSPSSPVPEPSPRGKKKSRIPAIIVTLFFSFIIIVSIVATHPLGYSPPVYHLHYSTPESGRLMLAGHMDLTGPLQGLSVDNGQSIFYDVDHVLLTGTTGPLNYTNATLQVVGGHLAWWIDTTVDFVIPSGFALTGSSWEDETWAQLTVFTDSALEIMGHTSLLITQNCSVLINNHTHTGNIVFQLQGDYTSVHTGDTIGLGVSPTPLNATITPSSSPLLFEDLLDTLLEEEPDLDSTMIHLPFDANGMVLLTGTTGTTIVSGENLTYSTFCYARGNFTAMIGDTISLDGDSHFIITDTEAFHNDTPSPYIPFIPRKIMGFWPMAIGIWAITRFFTPRKKKPGRPWENTERSSLKYWAAALHLLLLFTSLYLWDREIYNLFGRSILSILFSSIQDIFTPSLANPLLLMVLWEFTPWCIAILLIGLPLSISINALLQIWSRSSRGKGIGKGVGDMITWLIGQAYIIFFLNIAFSLTTHLFGWL